MDIEKPDIMPTLKYIKNVCLSNTDYCIQCPFYIDKSGHRACFFNFMYDGTVPMEWNLDVLVNQQKGE